jgi:hypothetical protein
VLTKGGDRQTIERFGQCSAPHELVGHIEGDVLFLREIGCFFRRSPSPIIRFANKYDLSLDWLVCGDVARLGRHRVKDTAGKIAISPLGKPAA